jgi:hypothetical protein
MISSEEARRRVTNSAPHSTSVEPGFAPGKVASSRGSRGALGRWGLAESVLLPEQHGQRRLCQEQAQGGSAGASRLVCRWVRKLRSQERSRLEAQVARHTGHRGSSVEGRACTILFHAETSGSRSTATEILLAPAFTGGRGRQYKVLGKGSFVSGSGWQLRL